MSNYIDFLNKNDKSRVFLIAEAGVNHENSLDKAIKMIQEASISGADAIKFQTYKASTLASTKANSYWDTAEESETNQHALFSKFDKFNFEDYEVLKSECDRYSIEFSTSIFDANEVDKYSTLVNFFKIASADIDNYSLHKEIVKYNKPVILSTGAATIAEISRTVDFYKSHGIKPTLLHCVLNYPCNLGNSMLLKIPYLKNIFPDLTIGYSDHVPMEYDGLQLDIAKVLGAQVIEKHFSFDKSLKGNDHYHSMDKIDLKNFRKREEYINMSLSEDFLNLDSQRLAKINARRSIVANRDLKRGEIINPEMISVKRPGTGIEPIMIDIIIGLELKSDLNYDEPLQWHHFK